MLPEAEALKEEGNKCLEQKKFIEGMLHYTKAIKIEPNNPALYSNRSLAFLRIQQHYHALDDAKTCNRLMPGWPKGYFRKGEVYYDVQHYREAYEAYQEGLSKEPGNKNLLEASAKAYTKMKAQEKAERRMPWLGTGIGLLLAVFLVACDELLTPSPVLQNPLFKVLVVIAATAIGFGLATGYRALQHSQRSSLLDPPIDLFPDLGSQQPSPDKASKGNQKKSKEEKSSTRQRTRRSKS